jgi:hypothetical protein
MTSITSITLTDTCSADQFINCFAVAQTLLLSLYLPIKSHSIAFNECNECDLRHNTTQSYYYRVEKSDIYYHNSTFLQNDLELRQK